MDISAVARDIGHAPAEEANGHVLRELSPAEIDAVGGGFQLTLSGFDGAAAIMATVGFGSLFTPIGPITGGIALGAAGGLAVAQAAADLEQS